MIKSTCNLCNKNGLKVTFSLDFAQPPQTSFYWTRRILMMFTFRALSQLIFHYFSKLLPKRMTTSGKAASLWRIKIYSKCLWCMKRNNLGVKRKLSDHNKIIAAWRRRLNTIKFMTTSSRMFVLQLDVSIVERVLKHGKGCLISIYN